MAEFFLKWPESIRSLGRADSAPSWPRGSAIETRRPPQTECEHQAGCVLEKRDAQAGGGPFADPHPDDQHSVVGNRGPVQNFKLRVLIPLPGIKFL